MPFAKNGNIDIYYEVHGQGDWLVLSHEFAGSYKCWRPAARRLRQGIQGRRLQRPRLSAVDRAR